MIHELRIHGLGVIEDAVVPFAPGLTVLTGETGAGKTMLLTGLGLLMGAKVDPGVVRSGSDRADVDGEWRIPAGSPEILALLETLGARTDDEGGTTALILGRSVAAEGRSRAFAGGRIVPSGALADITERLVAVHGQSDQLMLRDSRRQLELLDRFAGGAHVGRLEQFGVAYHAWRAAERERDELMARRQEREREATLMRLGIEEISAVQPEPDEDEHLKAKAAVLANATDLQAEMSTAHDLLVGGEAGPDQSSAVDLIGQARRFVERAVALDPSVVAHVARLDEVIASLDQAASELSGYVRGIDADPALLAHVEERRQLLAGLKRKYGPGLPEVLGWWEQAQRTVEQVDSTDLRLEKLTGAAGEALARMTTLAAQLTKGRRTAAIKLSAAVSEELRALAMSDAELRIDVETASGSEGYSADGADGVVMLLRPHAGGDFRPLGKGASGGELSRIMLAIEVVLAGVESVPTFVFDEVDAGIGGKVAVEVGRRLARLARSAQVIVVTHLPQVAAFADRQVVVAKGSEGQVTSASVTVVEGEQRVQELVRMLSGLEGSASGAEHASELLELASRERA
jgi:DNA repair protein RecN (Recombination protein N)